MDKLYKALYDQGKYTKSAEDFKTQFGSQEGQKKLYSALNKTGAYTRSFDDFNKQFFTAPIESVKTNDSAAADPSVESNATGSNWADGSSGQLNSGFISENNRGKREKRLKESEYDGTMISRMFDDNPNNSFADNVSESFKDYWKGLEKNYPAFMSAQMATSGINNQLGAIAAGISKWVQKDDAEDEAAITNNPELFEKYNGYRNDVSLDKQAEQLYNNKDLSISDTDSNLAYNTDKSTDFVNEYYINNSESKKILEDANVSASDFQGFLNRKGYIEDFVSQKEAGAYQQDDSDLPDNLTMQQDLKRYFDEYLLETAGRNIERVVLEEIKNNPSDYKDMGLDEAMEAADAKLMEDPEKYNYGTHLDFNKLENWNSNNWESISKYTAEQIKNIEEAQNTRIEETEIGVKTGLYGTGRTILGALGGLGDGLEDAYDFFKADGKMLGFVYSKGRQANEFRDLRDKSNRRALRGGANINYLYAEGKQVTLNDKEYIKQANGSIKQITNGFDVSKTISNKDRKAIDDAIANGDYTYGSDFDGFGGSIVAGRTIGELAIQLLGQKGTSSLRKLASLKYLGKAKNLSKARLARLKKGVNSKGNMRGVNYSGVTGGAKGNWDTFGKKIPLGISKGMADAIIFQSGYGAMTGYNQAKTAALDAGMGMEESEAIANEASLGMAALFALTTPINPKTGLIDKIFKGTGKNSTVNLFTQLINASGNAAGIRKNFAKIVAAPLQTKLAKFGAVVASEGAKEMVQENVQQIGEAALNKVLNKGIGKDLLKDTYTYEDFVNTSALSFAAGGFAGGVGSISTLTGRKSIMNDSEKVQKLRQLMQNPDKVEKIFDSWVKNGDITRKEADGLNQEIQKFGRNINKMPKFLSDRRMSTELLKVIDSQENISKLEKQRKNAIPGEQVLIDEKLKVLKEQQTKLLVDAQTTLDADNKVFEGKFTKNTAAVVNFARKLGFGKSKLPRIFENTDAYVTAIYRALKRKERSYLKAVKEGKIKADPDFKPLTKAEVAKQAAESDGVYLGAGSLFINKEMARQTGKWTVTSHEIIHPILNSLVGSYLNQKANYDDLMKILPAKVRRSINKKIEQTQGKEKQATEFLNYLSDAVISGELDYDPSLFDKIRLWFNNIISKLGLKSGIENHEDLHFDDARGVYNWLKEFTSGLKEGGEISDKAVEAVQKAETKANRLVSEDPGLRDPENAMQFSSSQEILNLENALDDALDAFAEDPNNPTLEQKVEEAERLLEEAEERVSSGRSAIKQEAKPKPKPKKKVEAKPVRTTDLGPRDPKSKKIMDTYNEGMEGVERTEYKASKPLPASLEKKLIPLFEGYINTIVQQKFKQVGPEALEFQDALSILRAEVASAIRTFNPAVNKDLAGYVKRYGVQARQSLMFADANKEFASALDDAKGIVATNDEVSVDRSGAVERGQSTFDQLDIVDDNLIKEISTELEKEIRIRTQKGTLSESRKVTQKVKGKSYETLVPWIEDYVEKALFKKLSKKLGAIGQTKDPTTGEQKTRIPGPYIDFLNDKNTFDIITKALPIKTLKSNYSKLFKVTKIGREKTAEGNPIFKVEPTTPKAFLQYFLDAKFGTLLARQKQLFREILRPVAKEVVADYATPENISELKSIQELAPKTSIDITSDIALEAQLNNLESILDRYKGEEKSFDIIQFSNSLKNTFGLEKDKVDFTNYKQIISARSGLIKLFRSFKKEGFSAETVANMFVGTSRGSYGLLAEGYITIEKGNLLKILNLKTKKWRTNRFLLTGTADLFELLKKVYKNVDYTKGMSDFKQDGKTIELDKIPSQGTKGFVDGSMFYGKSVSKSSILDRKAYSQKQKSNLKNIIERLTEVHNNKYLTSNQVAMILGTLASSTKGLVRTAATLQGYSKQLLKNAEIIDDNFRFEHSQAAAFTVNQLAKLITDKNYPYTFDQIMDGFNVFIIPKVYDVIIGKVPGFYSGGPVDSKGYMVLSTAKYVARYQDPKVLKAIADAGLPPLVLTQFSKSDLSAESSQVDLNKIGLESDSNHGSLLRIQFSKSARKKYENVLRNKRPELKDIPAQVDELFKWADGLKVADNKKSKYKKLALYYTANGYTIFPEDGYKIEEAIRLSEANKVDPYAYKNPDELINKFTKEEKTKKINPDTVKEFSNKRSLPKGVTIYDVNDSKAGQRAVRSVVDSNWGKEANPWCLIARSPKGEDYIANQQAYSIDEFNDIMATESALGNRVEIEDNYTEDNGTEVWELVVYGPSDGDGMTNAWEMWKNYNKGGYGYEIAFQNGKLLSFRDGGNKILDDDGSEYYDTGEVELNWWDRFDKPTDTLQINLGKKNGLTTRGEIYFNEAQPQGEVELVGYGEGDFMSRKDTYKLYDENKELIEAKVYKDGKLSLAVENTPTKMNDGGRAINSKKSKYIDGELISSVTTVKDLKTGKIVTTTTLSHEKLNENRYIETFTVVGKNGKSPTAPKVTEKTIGLIEKRGINLVIQIDEYYAEKITDGVSEIVIDRMVELNNIKKSLNEVLQFSKSEGSSINIYHGGDIKKIDDINGIVYFSEDKAQAAEYAKGNEGKVAEFKIKESDIVSEDVIYNEINELGLKARDGFEVDELNLYELIDPAFETSLSKSDLAKLFKSLNKKGIKAVRFTDMNLKSLKNDISNIAVFDKKSIIDQTEALQFSKNLDKEFNDIIEESTGIESGKTIYEAASKNIGRTKGRFKFFIPPSAEDFVGLMYKLLSKGKKGEKQQAWLKKALFDPYAEAMRDFESYKQNATGIVKQLTKSLKKIPSSLTKNNSTGFTNEQAIRVFIWSKKGYDIPGLSKQEAKDLIAVVKNDPKLLSFADEIESSLNGYPEPSNSWYSGTITTDAVNMINTTKRAEFLKEWQANSDIIFSKDNINKLRSEFGINYSEALEDMLYRMKTGRNRPTGDNKLTNIFMNWINDSVGTIMFFNSRSALLQTLSIVNFVNWSDNNPVKAAKAFSNQKQFWKDFSMLFNSDFLKQRRSGLKNDINADDIARSAETSRNKARAVLSTILKAGFLPTQIADSFAIAMGGASFIRNRTDSYISEGMSKKEAETKAFLDFQEIAEETQQSSRPDRVSQQQASPLGRIILAFANTPMQYMRLTKKAFLDLKNNRGDWKTNVSKIVYYTAIQNVIFSSLQAAMFASLFEDDDEEAIKDKQLRTANSMLDSVLRGVGVYGAIGSTLKNIYLEVNKQSNKDRPDYTQAALKALTISPPVDSKMRKIISASRAFSYKTTRDKMKGFGLDNPAYYAGGQIVSAAVNVPVDRVIRKIENVRSAFSNETEYWQKAALIFGYSKWDLGLIKDESKSGTWRSRTSKNKTYKTSKWKKRQ